MKVVFDEGDMPSLEKLTVSCCTEGGMIDGRPTAYISIGKDRGFELKHDQIIAIIKKLKKIAT